MDPPASGGPSATAGPAAIDALLAVLRPLARLAIDHGIQFGQLEELLKRALIDAATHNPDGTRVSAMPPASRISMMTGIHRKDVKRLTEQPGLDAVRAESTPVSELFTRWATDPAWHDTDGRPRVLPRRQAGTDDAPSFERLARSVTTDVHPRTLLDELARLGLVAIDADADTVALGADAFVPAGQLDGLLAFLGANVGDHLAAARANVAHTQRAARDGASGPGRAPFVEQALYADELSMQSAELAAERARAFWQTLLHSLAPELQRLEDADRVAGRAIDQRIRIGLYAYSEPMPAKTPRLPDPTE